MKSTELRKLFLQFFEENGHAVVQSSSLVPAEDPTLLFTNAGMNQFKSVFLGEERREYTRAASSQKCLRAGGKHNDLENVGKTNRHLTFFEMLGNFSFGDYFKQEAIALAWKLLTVKLGLPSDRLWISVFEEDDEAFNLWRKVVGVSDSQIHRLGAGDNFWSMGDTGPCGPCSEIGIDLGEEFSCGKPDCGVGCDCDRYLELWNLVFMQYNRDAGGSLTPLPKPSIDTGMGLERIASVLQNAPSNFEIDIMMPVIERTSRLCGLAYEDNMVSFRVIADHARALTFAITDGVMPSNEGRGYVIRRILRRAARHGRILGLEDPFLFELVDDVVDAMVDQYEELGSHRDHVKTVVRGEEERFQETLTLGLNMFDSLADELRSEQENVIPGEKAFVLYDTYGFPIDLTTVMAEERGMKVDLEGFERALEKQRDRARRARTAERDHEAATLPESDFIGYDELSASTVVKFIAVEGEEVPEAQAGTQVSIVIDPCPFYGESGGQLGDSGRLSSDSVAVDIRSAGRRGSGTTVLDGVVERGVLRQGERIRAEVDRERRNSYARAHTATHLLHAALRELLGSHVQQSGSLVAPDRVRFDFTHYDALAPDQTTAIEMKVNEWIRDDRDVNWIFTGIDEARKMGALAFFGEKYGDVVRVVSIDGVSQELCGGTHVSSTGRIGSFHLISEGSVALGVRRVEAVTGRSVLDYIAGLERLVGQVVDTLRVGQSEVPEKVAALVEENKNLRRELKQTVKEAAVRDSTGSTDDTHSVNGIEVLAKEVDVPDMESLREVADHYRSRMSSGVIVLASGVGGKAIFVATVSEDLVTARGLSAGEIIKKVSGIAGGGGGGKPGIAQAGGRDVSKIPEALAAVPGIVAQSLGKE